MVACGFLGEFQILQGFIYGGFVVLVGELYELGDAVGESLGCLWGFPYGFLTWFSVFACINDV